MADGQLAPEIIERPPNLLNDGRIGIPAANSVDTLGQQRPTGKIVAHESAVCASEMISGDGLYSAVVRVVVGGGVEIGQRIDSGFYGYGCGCGRHLSTNVGETFTKFGGLLIVDNGAGREEGLADDRVVVVVSGRKHCGFNQRCSLDNVAHQGRRIVGAAGTRSPLPKLKSHVAASACEAWPAENVGKLEAPDAAGAHVAVLSEDDAVRAVVAIGDRFASGQTLVGYQTSHIVAINVGKVFEGGFSVGVP